MKNILIVNHCSHNKGDNSVLYFLIKLIKINYECNITVSISGARPFWLNDDVQVIQWGRSDLYEKVSLKTIFNKIINKIVLLLFIKIFNMNSKFKKIFFKLFFSKKYVEAVQNADIVISTGGHHLSTVLDKGGINQQFLDLLYVVTSNKKLILWSQSIGPFDGVSLEYINLLSQLFSKSEFIFARGISSVNWVHKISNIKSNIFLVEDTVFAAKKLDEMLTKSYNETLNKYIVLSVYSADGFNLERNESIYVDIIEGLISKGYFIKVLPMQYYGMSGDERKFINNMISKLSNNSIKYIELLNEDKSPVETLNIIRSAFCVVTHKTHPMVYGLSMSVPVIALAYHPKFYEMMGIYNLEKFVMNPENYNNLDFMNLFEILEDSREAIVHNITDKTELISSNIISLFSKIQ